MYSNSAAFIPYFGWQLLLERQIKELGIHYKDTMKIIYYSVRLGKVGKKRLDPGMDTPGGFFQVGNPKEYQRMIIIPFVHLEKITIFCFMHKGVAQKLVCHALLKIKL